METTFDFTLFFWVFFVCMLIGLFSAIYKKPVEKVMKAVEESASGHAAPYI